MPASFDGADGVVLVKESVLLANTTPSARAKELRGISWPRSHPSSAEEGSFPLSMLFFDEITRRALSLNTHSVERAVDEEHRNSNEDHGEDAGGTSSLLAQRNRKVHGK